MGLFRVGSWSTPLLGRTDTNWTAWKVLDYHEVVCTT